MTPIPTNKEIGEVCADCGISANFLTCLKKYGQAPFKLAFDVSTSHEGKCDFCGETKSITQTRDYFYPDFSLLKEFPKFNYKSFIHLLRENDRKAVLEWAEKNKREMDYGGYVDTVLLDDLKAFLSSNHKER